MHPTPNVRRFEARLRLLLALRRIVSGVDASDVLTVLALVGIGTGIGITFGIGWGLFVGSAVLAAMTPIGAAVRLLVRGR